MSEAKIKEDKWDCVFKSQGITLSQLIKEARREGIEIVIENGRENLLAYLQTKINNFLEKNKTLEDFKDFLNKNQKGRKKEVSRSNDN